MSIPAKKPLSPAAERALAEAAARRAAQKPSDHPKEIGRTGLDPVWRLGGEGTGHGFLKIYGRGLMRAAVRARPAHGAAARDCVVAPSQRTGTTR